MKKFYPAKNFFLLFLSMTISIHTYSQSMHTVLFTGNPSDFNIAEKFTALGPSVNTDYYITFDAANLYIAAFRTGGSTFASSDNFTIYLDTDPSSTPAAGTGTTVGQNYNGTSGTLPFSANYTVHAEQSIQDARSFPSSWLSTISGLAYFTNSTSREVSIPLSSIGSPNALYLCMWMGTAGGFYANAPGANLASSSNPTIANYFGGIGVSSADCIPVNTVNTPITSSITNAAPTAGAVYGKVMINTGTITNTGNWTLAPGGSIVVSGGTFALGAQTITLGSAATSNGKGTTINTTGAGSLTTTASTIFDCGGEVNFIGNSLSIAGSIRIRNRFTGMASGGLTIASGGSLDVRAGGFVNNNPPTYAAGSFLKYNTGTSYTASNEWVGATSSGVGVPANVTIGDLVANSVCSFGTSSQFRQLTGSIIISNATAGAALNLSTVAGGDLKIGGNWTNNATFTPNSRGVFFNGTTAQLINATATFPNLYIQNTTANVTAASAITVSNSLTVDANARLDMATFGFNLTGAIANVNGYLRRGLTTDGALTGVSSATLVFANGGAYEHNFSSIQGTIPFATWSSGSTCAIIGYTSAVTLTSAGGWGQAFSNFTWNCTNQAANSINLLGLLTGVSGNFNVASTGTTGTLIFNTSAPVAPVLNVGGNFLISGGTFNVNAGTSTPIINLSGNYIQTGGVFSKSGTGVSTFNCIKTTGIQTLSQTAGSISANLIWNFGNGTTTNTVQLLSNVGVGAGTVNVSNNASLDFKTFFLTGTGPFNGNNGSTLISAEQNGIQTAGSGFSAGSLQMTGVRTFSAGISYIFNGAINGQGTGDAIGQSTIKNLTFANTGTGNPSVFLQQNITIQAAGALTMTSGIVQVGPWNVTINNNSSGGVVGGSSTAYLRTNSTGQVKRVLTTTAGLFPVGNSTYNPITLTGNATSETYGVKVIDVSPALSGVNNPGKTINRRWDITEVTAGGNTVTPAVTFNSGEEFNPLVFATGVTPYVGKLESSVWTQNVATSSGSTTYTANSSFSPTTTSYSIAAGKDEGIIGSPAAPNINISGGIAVSSPGSGTSGYVGCTVTINGSSFGAVTAVKIGGSAGTPVSFTVVNSLQITFTAINLSGQIYVENSAGNALSTETYLNLGFITNTGATNWNTASSWLGGALPANGASVTIAHALTIAAAVINNPAQITINNGITATVTATVPVFTATGILLNNGTLSLTGAAGSLTTTGITNSATGTISFGASFTMNLAASATFINNGTFTAGTGSIGFINAGIIAGSAPTTFNNLNLSAGLLTFTTLPIINGVLSINGGSVSAAPIYTASSTLQYGLAYTRGIEWSAVGIATIGVTPGYPNNVTINNGTFNLLNSDAGTARAMNGSLTVNTGASFLMGQFDAVFTIGGNLTTIGTGSFTMNNTNQSITIGGSVSIAATGSLTLSTTLGADVYVAGNFANSGAFTHNSRSVIFNGTSATTQTISGTALNTSGATNCFAYLINNNSNAGITIGANVTISATTGNALQLLNTGTFKIGAFALTLNGSGGNILVSGGSRTIDFISAAGNFRIIGTANTTNKTILSAAGGLLNFTSTGGIGAQVQLSTGAIDFGAGITTINTGVYVVIQSNGYVANNSCTYASGSVLSFRNGAAYTVGAGDKTWAAGASGAGVPDKVELNFASTIVAINEDRTCRGTLTLINGSVQNNNSTLTVAPTITIGANALAITSVNGNFINAGGNVIVGPTGGGNQTLSIVNGNFSISAGNLSVNGGLVQSSGVFTMTGGSLTIDPNSGVSSTSLANGTTVWSITNGTQNITGGNITIVDPPNVGTAKTLNYSSTANASWLGNTLILGGSTGTNASTGTVGFSIDCFAAGTGRLTLGDLQVNGGNTSNRYVGGPGLATSELIVGGTLAIVATSELRLGVNDELYVSGNIINNGTFTSLNSAAPTSNSGALHFSSSSAGVANTALQTVTGSGLFRNSTTASTANFMSIDINNTLPSVAVDLTALGNVAVSVGTNLSAGVVLIGNNSNLSYVGNSPVNTGVSGFFALQGTGKVLKDFAIGASAFTFRVGDNTGVAEYSPVVFNITSNSIARTIGVGVTDAVHPNLQPPLTLPVVDYASRYWTFYDSQTSSLTYDITFTFLSADVNGTAANIKASYFDGLAWVQTGTNLSPTMSTASTTLNGLNNIDYTGRNEPGINYVWNGSVSQSWTNSNNWTPTGIPSIYSGVTIVSGTPNNLLLNSAVTIGEVTLNGNFSVGALGSLTVTGNVIYLSGSATWDCASTFTVTSSGDQVIPPFNFGNINATGGPRTLSPIGIIGICGAFTRGAGSYTIANSTVNYNATGAQTISVGTYHNLTISNNRSSASLTLPTGTIDIASALDVSALSNYTPSIAAASTINFSSSGNQTIPAFYYGSISNSGNGNRTWASTGIIDIANSFLPGTGTHTITGSTIRYSNALASSNTLINSITTNINSRSYNNLIINGNTSTWSVSGGTLGIAGNLNITAGTLLLGSAAGVGVVNVDGTLTIDGGTLNLTNSATNAGTFNLFGNFVMTSGALNKSAAAAGALNFIHPTAVQTITQSGGTISTAFNLNIGNGSTSNTVQLNTSLASGTCITTVNAGSSIDMGASSIITGTGSFVLLTSASIITANSSGITASGAIGSIQTTTRNFGTAANFTFNGTTAQSTGTGLPATMNNLTISNAAGVSLSSTTIVNGTFTLNAGILDIANIDLTIGSNGTISGAGPGKYVRTGTGNTGQLKKLSLSIAFTFAVGNSSYNPLTLSNSSVNDTYGVRVVDAALTGTLTPSLTINRRWDITEGAAGSSILIAAPTYNAGSEENNAPTYNAASPGNAFVGFFASSVWTQKQATISGTNPYTYTTNTTLIPTTNAYSIGMGKDNGLTTAVLLPTILSVGGVVASPNNGIAYNGYIGSTVTITGTNLGTVSQVKVGGSAGTAVTILSQTATTITFNASTLTGQIYVVNPVGNTTSVESYVNKGYITAPGATIWNTTISWLGGALPILNSDVTIAHNLNVSAGAFVTPVSNMIVNSGATLNISATVLAITVTNSITNNGVVTFTGTNGSLTCNTFVNNGTLSWTAAATLNLSANGTLTNNAIYTAGIGNLNIINAATINGSSNATLNNITLNAGILNFSTPPTINGVFTINSGSVSASPIYSSNSTLKYAVSYTRGAEWNANGIGTIGVTAGYPNHVNIQTGTFQVLNADAGTARAMNGNLVVNTGCTFAIGALNANFTIGGNLTTVGTGSITLAATNSPLVVSGNITIAVSGALTLSSVAGGDVYVAGNFTNNGSFTHNNRSLVCNGTSASVQSISGVNLNSTGATNNLSSLRIDNTGSGVSIADSIRIISELVLSNGNLTTNNKLRLMSTATNNARIAPVSNGASITGKIFAERFIPLGLTGWVTLSNPIQNDSIKDWMDDFATSGFTGSTGPAGNFISVYGYDETTNGTYDHGYNPATSSSNVIQLGKGYYVFVGTALVNSADITMDVCGEPYIGNFSFPVSYTASTPLALTNDDGWNLIANPYCSAIDWSNANWTKTNVGAAIYSYNTDLQQYTSFANGLGVNGGSNVIEASQGFWVKTTGASPQLIATENTKTTSANFFFKSNTQNNLPPGALKIGIETVDGKDETVLRVYSGASESFDADYDAIKKFSSNTNTPCLASEIGGLKYAINNFGSISMSSIPLYVHLSHPGMLKMKFSDVVGFNQSMSLRDEQTGLETPIMNDTSLFLLIVDTTQLTSRFSLVFDNVITTSVSNQNAMNLDFQLYPNPGNDQLTLVIEGLGSRANIKNALGETVISQIVQQSLTQINTASLASGIYQVQVMTIDGRMQKKTWIKR